MASGLVIALSILFIFLALGAIGVGVYIAVFRSQPQNAGKEPQGAIIALIMLLSFLLGLLAVAAYFLLTGKECTECYWSAKDVAELKNAQVTIDSLKTKSNSVPRNLGYSASCDSGASGCGVNLGTVCAVAPKV